MAVKSGIPTTINGVQVGATDFSEFLVGAGLPPGITGLSANFAALSVGIDDTPVSPSFTDEGKYFEILNPITFNFPWAFVIDAFDGIMEQGELLARISCNFNGLQNRNLMGPGMSLREAPGIDGSGSVILDSFSSGDVEVGGAVFLNGGVANVGTFPISQALQEDDWIWVRVRKTNNVASPSEDDWQVTAWYGDIEDEPAVPDGIDPAPQNFTAPRGLFGIGCTYISPGATGTQRVAFLSYSENPDVEPPPVPPLGEATIWTPFPQTVIARGLPKPTIFRPIVEFDVRLLGFVLNDGDQVALWEDLVTSDVQGRTDAGSLSSNGNVLFVVEGWTPGIDAVRFVASPIGAPAGNGQGNLLSWPGGGIGGSDWVGNEYTIFGVMRATDISVNATFIGNDAGISPNFPKKVAIWVQPDGSVAVHHTDEENAGNLQPGSIYSLETAPGLVEPGDDIIIALTASSSLGKVLRINGVEVARNDQAFAVFVQETISPTLGQGFPEQLGNPGNPGVVGGLDRLIVYASAFGSLASIEQIQAYESFLADAFQLDFRTQWTDQPEVSPGTVWANIP